MKKITGYFLISALVAFNVSCKKEEEDTTVTKTINVTLQMNESYSVRVTGDEDDVMNIIQQASHFSVSEIAAISGSKDVLFNYTPTSEYIGTDEVHLSSTEGEHQGGGHGHGNCSGGGHHDETTVYVYKITINGENH